MIGSLRRRFASLTATCVAVLGLLTVPASPAHAADDGPACKPSTRSFEDRYGDWTSITVELCVQYEDGAYRTWGRVTWSGGGGGDQDGNRRFDNVLVTVRLEQYDGRDNVMYATSCNYRGLINKSYSSPIGGYQCAFAYAHNRNHTWSADGSINIDWDGDGAGYVETRDLDGTRRID